MATSMPFSTADLSDRFGELARIPEQVFHDFGGCSDFHGIVATVRTDDPRAVLRAFEEPGQGRVLVVDGGGIRDAALMGDRLASVAIENGWTGTVIYGAVRDTAKLSRLPFGVRALVATPRRSVSSGTPQSAVTVNMAGVKCSPGDLVFVDADGVVILGAENVEEDA